MKKAYIRFEKCKVEKCEDHNTRKKELDYLVRDSTDNESFYFPGFENVSLTEIMECLKADYESTLRGRNHCGQRIQANWSPIREAVVLIKESTTMDDIKRLCVTLSDKYGMEAIQAHIHRDEGYIVKKGPLKGETISNLHAHLIFSWYNIETHKNNRYTAEQTSEMQNVTAETLNMANGISSNKHHLDSIEFKIIQEQETLEELQREHQELKEIREKQLHIITQLNAQSYKELCNEFERKKEIILKIEREKGKIEIEFNKKKELQENSSNEHMPLSAAQLKKSPESNNVTSILGLINNDQRTNTIDEKKKKTVVAKVKTGKMKKKNFGPKL